MGYVAFFSSFFSPRTRPSIEICDCYSCEVAIPCPESASTSQQKLHTFNLFLREGETDACCVSLTTPTPSVSISLVS